jgi:hypothetical protein
MGTTRVRIKSANDYMIKFSNPEFNEVVIPTSTGPVILEIDRIPTFSMSAELAMAESMRMKAELKRMAEEMRALYPTNLLESIFAFPGQGGTSDEPRVNL